MGIGTRKEVTRLIKHGKILWNGQIVQDPFALIDPTKEHHFQYKSLSFSLELQLYLVLNKPQGYECSHSPHPNNKSIFELFPERFNKRKYPIRAAGRLDVDTTGLILISDDGQFIEHFQNKENNVQKVYKVTTKHPLTSEMIQKLSTGVQLVDEFENVSAVAVEQVGENVCKLVLKEGKYHQVKRMLAAVGNRVVQLERVQIGGIKLEELGLQQGEWRALTDDEINTGLNYKKPTENKK